MNNGIVKVLIVDDSAVMRGLLAKALEADPGIKVAGTAMHGLAALQWLRKNPVDVVVLDVEMPVMDGLTALKQILQEFPGTHAVMASSMTYQGAATTMQALTIGAAACIAKPVTDNATASIAQVSRELLPLVKALTKPAAHETATPQTTSKPALPRAGTGSARMTPKVVVIGASTGGPNALSTVISGLGPNFRPPVLITQHMPPLFTPMLAKHLQQDGGRPACEGTHGMVIEPGHTYVAPGGFHMAIDRKNDRMILVLNEDPPEHFCRPSVNPLYRSAAKWYAQTALAVMLTGMGEDGIEGARDLAAVNAPIFVQDEASSVVWGMPAAIANAGLADRILSLDEMAPAILEACRETASVR